MVLRCRSGDFAQYYAWAEWILLWHIQQTHSGFHLDIIHVGLHVEVRKIPDFTIKAKV